MASEVDVLTAVTAIANSALPAKVRAYSPSKVPSPRPTEHVVVTIARRAGGPGRAGRYVTKGWAVYFMAVSQTSDHNARNSLDRIDAALANRVLEVGDEYSTPVAFANSRPVAPDDGWFSGNTAYNFAI